LGRFRKDTWDVSYEVGESGGEVGDIMILPHSSTPIENTLKYLLKEKNKDNLKVEEVGIMPHS